MFGQAVLSCQLTVTQLHDMTLPPATTPMLCSLLCAADPAGPAAVDGQSAVLSGVLRGSGRQGIGAATSWCSYWLVGLPLAYVLAFKANMGVLGLRLSLAAAVAVQALVLHVYTSCKINWEEEVARAQELVAGEQPRPEDEGCGPEQGLFGSGSGLLVPAGPENGGGSAALGMRTGSVSSSLQRPLLGNEHV